MDKSIGVLKITYGHHPWGQERPPCIRKALSGTFKINYFLDTYISVVYQFVCIFQDKSDGEVNLSQDYHPHWIRKTPYHPPSGTFLIH